MEKIEMVGEEEVKETSTSNALRQGAGENTPLKPKGNFRRRPHRPKFQIIDAIGRKHGPFKTAKAMAAFAQKRFRHQTQDDERAGRYPTGFDVQVAGVK